VAEADLTGLLGLLSALVRLLEDEGTEYMLVGGVGLAAWTPPRATTDIDLVVAVAEDEAARFGARLGERLGGVASMRPIQFPNGVRMQRVVARRSEGETLVDLILAADPFLREALARRVAAALPGLGTLYVATPEDLLLMKLRAARPQDLVDARLLVGDTQLDDRYLDRQARKLRVLSRLRKLRPRK